MAIAVRTVAPGVVAALLWVLPRGAQAEPASAEQPAPSGGPAEWEEAPAAEATEPEPAEPRSGVDREPPAARPARAPAAGPRESDMAPVYEPPPPLVPRHVAPAYALWLGARLGGWVPFGTVWARCVEIYAGTCTAAQSIPYSDYSGAGPLVELDIGARLSRHYNVFVLWEHAALAGPSVAPTFLTAYQRDPGPASNGAQADYYAIGTRFSSNPDGVGFLAEIALGFRRMNVRWDDGTKLRLSNAPFEFRLGLGADLRLSQLLALSPMFTVGTGVFGDAEWSYPDGSRASGMGGSDLHAAHGWLALELGGHLDFGH